MNSWRFINLQEFINHWTYIIFQTFARFHGIVVNSHDKLVVGLSHEVLNACTAWHDHVGCYAKNRNKNKKKLKLCEFFEDHESFEILESWRFMKFTNRDPFKSFPRIMSKIHESESDLPSTSTPVVLNKYDSNNSFILIVCDLESKKLDTYSF